MDDEADILAMLLDIAAIQERYHDGAFDEEGSDNADE
jgi:hypothetical protein